MYNVHRIKTTFVRCPSNQLTLLLCVYHRSSSTNTNCSSSSSLPATVNKSTPLHGSTSKPSRSRHPLLLDSFRGNSKSNDPSRTPTTPSSSSYKFYKPKTPVASHKMEPRNLANILSSDDHIDTDIPSEEEQLRWALNASKVMMEADKPVEIDDDEDDPELTRVLEESRLLFEQQNNNNGITRHTPSPSGSPLLLCDGNVTTDSGYFSNNVDHSSEDPLQHNVSGAVINGL